MAVSGAVSFMKMTASLPSLPLFVGYMVMFAVSGLWQRWTAPFDLRMLLALHNLGCCLASAATCCGFSYAIFKNGSPYGRNIDPFLCQVFHLYWLTKVTELLETVLVLLCHYHQHVTVLHVYQRASILLFSDMARLFYPWPSIATFLTINSFAQVFHYAYYGMLYLNPKSPPDWKKTMGQLQLGQSLFILFLTVNGYRYHKFCAFSIVYGLSLAVLYVNWYIQEFFKTQPVRTDVRKRL